MAAVISSKRSSHSEEIESGNIPGAGRFLVRFRGSTENWMSLVQWKHASFPSQVGATIADLVLTSSDWRRMNVESAALNFENRFKAARNLFFAPGAPGMRKRIEA